MPSGVGNELGVPSGVGSGLGMPSGVGSGLGVPSGVGSGLGGAQCRERKGRGGFVLQPLQPQDIG